LHLRGRKWLKAGKRLRNEELHNLYATSVIKLRAVRRGGGACGRHKGVETTYKLEGKRPLGRPRRRWGTISEWILEKQGGKLWNGFIWLRIVTSGGIL